jgi:hypothetical protein
MSVFGAIQPGAVRSVSPCQGTDPTSAAGPPLPMRRNAGHARRPGGPCQVAFVWEHDSADAQVVQVILDAFLAVSTVGSDGPGPAPGAGDDRWSAGAAMGHRPGSPFQVAVEDVSSLSMTLPL